MWIIYSRMYGHYKFRNRYMDMKNIFAGHKKWIELLLHAAK